MGAATTLKQQTADAGGKSGPSARRCHRGAKGWRKHAHGENNAALPGFQVLANPDVRGGGVSTDVAECKTAILRPTFRHTNRRLSASCVQWAVGPRWTTPRFRFWCFSTSVSRPTEKVFGFSISKHHQSTDPDGGPFGGCSGTSKTMGKHESPYGNRRFRVSGGAGTRGIGGASPPRTPRLASD